MERKNKKVIVMHAKHNAIFTLDDKGNTRDPGDRGCRGLIHWYVKCLCKQICS